MRPVNLKIKGLHSFQEMQEVDFNKLCEKGTFGIFGPTGSGKSTVLDAITLALFGKVERAPRNIQGIINHACDEIIVKFIFELNSSEGSKRYLVERQYKRIANNSVQSGYCRLIEIQADFEKVLADKAREVDQQIISILGLTADDFTRAVVLPQGKFAEFLTLTGKDRRLMLQRLFNLEKFGDQLQQKVKNREENIIKELRGIEREQQGLGDASEDALKQAQKNLDEIIELEKHNQKELEEAEKIYNESLEIWQKQKQLLEIKEEKKSLEKKQKEISSLEEEMDKALRAENIKYIIEDSESINKAKILREEIYNKAIKECESLCNEHEKCKRDYLQAEKDLDENQPQLITKKTKLGEAIKYEEEIYSLKNKGLQVSNEIKNYQKIIKEIQSEIEQLQLNNEKNQKLLSERRNIIKKITVSPQYREQLNMAYYALMDYRTHKNKLEDLHNEFKIKQNLLVKTKTALLESQKVLENAIREHEKSLNKLQELEKECPIDERELLDNKKANALNAILINDILHITDDIENLTKEIALYREEIKANEDNYRKLKEKYKESKARLENLQNKKRKLEINNFASILSESLLDNEPCPVCGSREHPQPAALIEQDISKYQKEKAELDGLINTVLEEINSIEKEMYQKEHTIVRFQKDILQNQDLLDKKQNIVKDKRNELPDVWKDLDAKQLQLVHTKENKQLEVLEVNLDKWKQNVEDLKQRNLDLERDVNTAKNNYNLLNERAANNKHLLNELEKKISDTTKVTNEKKQKLDAVRNDIKIDDIEKKWQQLGDWDKQSDKIKKQIEELEKKLENTDLNIENLVQKINKYELEKVKLESILEQYKKEYALKKKNLHEITQGVPAKKLMEETNIKLETLKSNRITTKQNLDNIVEKLKKAEEHLTSSKADYEDILKRLDAITKKLAVVLQEQGFKDIDTAKACLRSLEERNTLKQSIEQYYEKLDRYKLKIKDLEAFLSGKELTENRWEDIKNKLASLKGKRDEILHKKGAAKQVLLNIESKHKRWNELNREYNKYQNQLNTVKELKRVLAGNAFVEYMAEEYLLNVARIASARLGDLTNNRYILEIDTEGGFVIRDDANGGYRRPVKSLSGGETFLVSLSLALALSSQIQLRGKYPLEFFFLDEGFGSLDKDLLEVVINALERLQMENLSIGVISHVQEMRERITRRLIVTPAQLGGEGTKLNLEIG